MKGKPRRRWAAVAALLGSLMLLRPAFAAASGPDLAADEPDYHPPVIDAAGLAAQSAGGLFARDESAAATVASDSTGCPVDERLEHCPAWAQAGECLRNPVFMRKFCKASCKLVPRCFARIDEGLWRGHATPAGTSRFALGSSAAEGHFRQHSVLYSGVDSAEDASLTLSSLGMGTYLGASDADTDEAVTSAVLKSIASGWNVIDTAANYRGGRAETAVGRALQSLRLLGDAERDQLFISSKAGYPPAGLLEDLLREGEIQAADVVGGVHSMHPSYLFASLDRSLSELGLSSLDLLFLHNPAEAQLAALGQEEFKQRLRDAFAFCEEARRAGKIRAYGIASWSCFRVPPGNKAHLSLESAVELARQVGGTDHGFRYIQLPVSAAMPEAWLQPWQEVQQGGSRTLVPLMQAAQQLGIGVFGSGPLLEAALLKDAKLTSTLQSVPQLRDVEDTAPRLLQLARSSPGLLTALVGHKAPKHVRQNGDLAQVPPLDDAAFQAAFKALRA